MKVEPVLYYLKIHIQYFKSMSQKTTEKSQENYILQRKITYVKEGKTL